MLHWRRHGALQALPICKASPSQAAFQGKQTLIWRDNDTICLRIRRRKNRQGGSGTLMRVCSCAGSRNTCAVHMLREQFFAHLPEGAEPWADLSADYARQRLRRLL